MFVSILFCASMFLVWLRLLAQAPVSVMFVEPSGGSKRVRCRRAAFGYSTTSDYPIVWAALFADQGNWTITGRAQGQAVVDPEIWTAKELASERRARACMFACLD